MNWTWLMIAFLFNSCFAVSTSNGDTVRMQWQNDYDGDLRIECGDKQGLFRVASQYEFASKDRQWQWVCRNVAKISLIGCGWTGWVNDFDEPFLFRCPANNILAGVQSHHASDREDRQWKFRCCRADKHFTMNCFASDYINDWHHRINYDVDQPHVFTGVYSFHTNEKEDRKWKIHACEFLFCSEI